MGLRDLWDMIVNNDDICFKHILPRLNQTDIKFLYEVNTETRALIKRSFRRDALKKKLDVREMSSISTLEFAWENRSLWPPWFYGERTFCALVAQKNKLELLKWIREEKKCTWDEQTIEVAAEQGNLEMLKYCVANECPVGDGACALAAKSGHLECLKYLHEEVEAPWDLMTAARAAQEGRLHILEYLVERKYDFEFNDLACMYAAKNGHLDCLKFLHETAKMPWWSGVVREAHENNHPECLQYLLDNDCPLPEGWCYIDGNLLCEATINEAVAEKDLEKVKYCVANQCLVDLRACTIAADGGQLEMLKYLHETAKAPWDYRTAEYAATEGYLHILEYLVECKYDEYTIDVCAKAAKNGHLDCLKFLHETAKAPWDSRAVREARECNRSKCLQYLLDNDCPLPKGWRYKNGMLYKW